MSKTKEKNFTQILILGLLTALGPFSIDMYLPGFQDIANDLHTTAATVALSLSSYFIGIAAGQLLYGPLLDRYGRKKPLYSGLLIYIIATATCLFVKEVNALIIIRFIQAIGSCAAAVTAMAMVRDLFGPKESARVFSLLLLVLGASPMIAPTAGGYIISVFGWRMVFVVLLVIGCLILIASIFGLPESYKPDPGFSLKPAPIIRNFLTVLRNRQFLTYAFAGSFAFAGLFAYVAGSPVVFMEQFQVDKKVYGWIFALLSVGFIGFSQFNALLLKKYRSEQIVGLALAAQVLVGIIFLVGNISGWYGLTATIVLLFLFLCCIGFSNPNATAVSLAPFTKNAGSASALMGAFQMGIGAIASIAVGIFTKNTATPMVLIIAVSSVMALIILLTGRKLIREKTVTTSSEAPAMMH